MLLNTRLKVASILCISYIKPNKPCTRSPMLVIKLQINQVQVSQFSTSTIAQAIKNNELFSFSHIVDKICPLQGTFKKQSSWPIKGPPYHKATSTSFGKNLHPFKVVKIWSHLQVYVQPKISIQQLISVAFKVSIIFSLFDFTYLES